MEVNSDSHNFVYITEYPLLPSFPRLSKLLIFSCPMLTSMPMFAYLQLGLDNNNNFLFIHSSFKTEVYRPGFHCGSRNSPPEQGLKNLTSLETLKIWRCNRLKSLFPGIQHLTALQDLYLHDCLELEQANDEDGMQWQGLKSLLSLTFSRLPKLVSLPLGLQRATTLKSLFTSKCENLTAIPEWIHNSAHHFKSFKLLNAPV